MMDYLQLAVQKKEELLSIRRHLHENPELSGEEYETLLFIRKKLEEYDISYIEVKDGGILGFIEGKGAGKRILLRADCDALPMEEAVSNDKTPKTCVSRKKGAAHTCGHDFHTASLLIAARILKEQKESWCGNVLLYFERSEEKHGIYQYNLLEYIEKHQIIIDSCFAFHVNTGKAGIATLIEGPSHAGSFSFHYSLKGKGGHGARPYLANNPISCFQSISSEIDRIRMTKISPCNPVTLTICNVTSGGADNVIPDTLSFGGNGRYFDRESAGIKMKEELERIVVSCAGLHGCEITSGEVGTPGIPNYNNPECVRFAGRVLRENFGEGCAVNGEASMGSETFAYLAALYPSILLFFGVINEEKGISYGIHHPAFDIDEDKAHLATAYTLAYAVEFLNGESEFSKDHCVSGLKELEPVIRPERMGEGSA